MSSPEKKEESDGVDRGTQELRHQHVVIEEDTTEVRRRARVKTCCPVDYFYHQRRICQREFEAAERLYALWYYGAERSPYTVSAMNGLPPRDVPYSPPLAMQLPEHKLATERKYLEAMRSLRGLVMQLIIYNVVCIGEWPRYMSTEGFNKHVGINRRNMLMHEGLHLLADHFGMPHYKDED